MLGYFSQEITKMIWPIFQLLNAFKPSKSVGLAGLCPLETVQWHCSIAGQVHVNFCAAIHYSLTKH